MFLRFDIDGLVTGFGNPDWSRTHGVATGTSPIVSALVDGGATCTGKTVVDDMAFGFVLLHIYNFDILQLLGFLQYVNELNHLERF